MVGEQTYNQGGAVDIQTPPHSMPVPQPTAAQPQRPVHQPEQLQRPVHQPEQLQRPAHQPEQPQHLAPQRLVVGVSGASGIPLAHNFVRQVVCNTTCEVHLVTSKSARLTAAYEAPQAFDSMLSMATCVYENDVLGEAIASGTFRTVGMVVIPCSMKTVAGIASGYSDNLLLRAADVTIKEQRPLVLVARETPLNAIHLRNLSTLAAIPNVSIMPPMLTYYHNPQTIEDMETQLIGKILERFAISYSPLTRWGEDIPTRP